MSRYFTRLARRSSHAQSRPALAVPAGTQAAPLELETRVESYAAAAQTRRDDPAAPAGAATQTREPASAARSAGASAFSPSAQVRESAEVTARGTVPAALLPLSHRDPDPTDPRVSRTTAADAPAKASTPPEARAVAVLREAQAAPRAAAIHSASPPARAFADNPPEARDLANREAAASWPDDRQPVLLDEPVAMPAREPPRIPARRSPPSTAPVSRSAAGYDVAMRNADAAAARGRDVAVHIGTVTVELRAPPAPTPPTPASAPARTAAPAPRTDASRFSPSRHYLRWS